MKSDRLQPGPTPAAACRAPDARGDGPFAAWGSAVLPFQNRKSVRFETDAESAWNRTAVEAGAAAGAAERIFEKTGVRSRCDLVGKVFFTQYEPRVRDTKRRMLADQPPRGGPRAG